MWIKFAHTSKIDFIVIFGPNKIWLCRIACGSSRRRRKNVKLHITSCLSLLKTLIVDFFCTYFLFLFSDKNRNRFRFHIGRFASGDRIFKWILNRSWAFQRYWSNWTNRLNFIFKSIRITRIQIEISKNKPETSLKYF